ncbi:hypothetical protein LTR70_003314 [Exophiala xenobiotica]|uniref:Uncharacterized protein n=1 Tax=Lithohypha guttulata TaxID=1690604 RepID=A0ABR0KMS3_9EURO|nr:hypothetical protein LTR24_001188 [Lithohypha guttulata]KAK5323636.1 hypothetical protein LTR70_003314 [Exophiala xenobiotica]
MDLPETAQGHQIRFRYTVDGRNKDAIHNRETQIGRAGGCWFDKMLKPRNIRVCVDNIWFGSTQAMAKFVPPGLSSLRSQQKNVEGNEDIENLESMSTPVGNSQKTVTVTSDKKTERGRHHRNRDSRSLASRPRSQRLRGKN